MGGKASASVQQQMSQQIEHHNLTGTLVVTATCTHANACVFAPFIIDVDKGIRSWNLAFPDDQMNSSDEKAMVELAKVSLR